MFFHALIDNAQTLAHLFDAYRPAVIAVAVATGWDIELELLISGVGLLLAEVPLEAAGAQTRAR